MDESVFFQFAKDYQVPVFIELRPDFLTPERKQFFEKWGFEMITDETPTSGQVLKLSEASPRVATRLGLQEEGDLYGKEKIYPHQGYRVYRYKGLALMVHSHVHDKWELGVMPEFFNQKGGDIVMTRFLSWALSPLGWISFWGEKKNQGYSIQGQKSAQGKSFFINVRDELIFTTHEVTPLKGALRFLREEKSLRKNDIRMSKEEFYSFLSTHATFWDFDELTFPLRQMIRKLSQMAEGLVVTSVSSSDLSLP